MATATQSPPPSNTGSLDCRVYERFECEISASCQPFVAQSSSEASWVGQIRNISVDGVGLVLPRRFERHTGLAVQLPSDDPEYPETLVVKVVHATAFPDRKWLLGCQFVSQLSEDHLQRLIDLALAREQMVRADTPLPEEFTNLDEVIFVGPKYQGKRPKTRIRNFRHRGQWPLQPGAFLYLRIEPSLDGPLAIRVKESSQHRGTWVIQYYLVEPPSLETLTKLGWSPASS